MFGKLPQNQVDSMIYACILVLFLPKWVDSVVEDSNLKIPDSNLALYTKNLVRISSVLLAIS
jgi:hypothetical protein